MKKLFVWPLVFVLTLACNGQREPVSSTSSAAVTASTGTVAPTNVASIVQVEFEGSVSIVFPDATSGKNPRAVVLKGNQHHPHQAVLIIPPDLKNVAEADRETFLHNATGADVHCDKRACFLSPVAELAMEIVDQSNQPIGPFPVTKDAHGLFAKLVPRLKRVSQSWGELDNPANPNDSPEMTDLDDNVLFDIPVAGNSDYSVFLHLTGGVLSAKAACGTAAYHKPSDGNQKSDYEKFAESVVLTGTTSTAAKLRFRQNGQTQPHDVEFDDTSLLHVIVLNVPPPNSGSSHFQLHAKVGKNKKIKLPKIHHDRDCEESDPRQLAYYIRSSAPAYPRGNVIGCSASTWP